MITLKLLQELTDIVPEKLTHEKQNEEYEGIRFTSNHRTFRSRLAKKTPNKKGYFVVFWEKDETGVNQAYLYEESPEILLVFISDNGKKGVFKFPKEVLLKKGILKNEKVKGKMGIRVYPKWEKELNKTAQNTQNWQLEFFSSIND